MKYVGNKLWVFLLFVASTAIAQAANIQGGLIRDYEAALSQATQISQAPPLYVQSRLEGDLLEAEVYALIDTPYEEFRDLMADVRNWCDFVSINLNVKACVHHEVNGQAQVDLYAGRKFYQAPEDAYLLQYQFQVQHNDTQWLDVVLNAEEGPLGTSHYRIQLQAMPYAKQTLVRFYTGYEQSFMSDMATRTYLNTLGRDKVGFTVVSHTEGGEPIYNDGVHAVIERNAMRYYLALQAYLDTRKLPVNQRHEARIQYWYDATMHYQVQLYELEREEYLAAKRLEHKNQQQLQAQVN